MGRQGQGQPSRSCQGRSSPAGLGWGPGSCPASWATGSAGYRSRAGPGPAPVRGLPGAMLRSWSVWLGRGMGEPGPHLSPPAGLGAAPAGRCDPAVGAGEVAGVLPWPAQGLESAPTAPGLGSAPTVLLVAVMGTLMAPGEREQAAVAGGCWGRAWGSATPRVLSPPPVRKGCGGRLGRAGPEPRCRSGCPERGTLGTPLPEPRACGVQSLQEGLETCLGAVLGERGISREPARPGGSAGPAELRRRGQGCRMERGLPGAQLGGTLPGRGTAAAPSHRYGNKARSRASRRAA